MQMATEGKMLVDLNLEVNPRAHVLTVECAPRGPRFEREASEELPPWPPWSPRIISPNSQPPEVKMRRRKQP